MKGQCNGLAGAASWVAYIAFVTLVAYGLASGELGVRGLIVAVAVCVIARIALAYVPNGGGMFFSAVAVVDIGLVLAIFKADVKL